MSGNSRTRGALGASARRLMGQMLAETVLLGLFGGGLGLVLARISVAVLASAHPQSLTQLGAIGIDWRAVVFTAAISVTTVLLFGLAWP